VQGGDKKTEEPTKEQKVTWLRDGLNSIWEPFRGPLR
jgi:hypothetical protein